MSLLSEIYQLCLSSPVICGCFLCLFCSLLLNLDSIHSSFSSMWDFALEENSGWVNFSWCLDALTPSIHTRESLDSSPCFTCCFQIGLLGFPVSSCITSYSSDVLLLPTILSIHLLILCISPSYSWIVPPGYFSVQQDTPSPGFDVKVYLLQLLFYNPLFCCSWRNS